MVKHTLFYTIILTLGLQTQQIQATPDSIGLCQKHEFKTLSTIVVGVIIGYFTSVSLTVFLRDLAPDTVKPHQSMLAGFIAMSVTASVLIGKNIGTGFANETIHKTLNP